MKWKYNVAAGIYCILILVACNANESKVEKKPAEATAAYTSITKASWLIGKWVSDSGKMHLSETWEKKNDSVYIGRSYAVAGADTVHHEDITIYQLNDTLYYEPVVTGQNNNKPVTFKNTSLTVQTMVFENVLHDFPTKIAYTQIAEDSLVAEVSGIESGKPAVQTFTMKRVQ